ncbi:endonuclease MutS2 [Aceticella autotrophica]|uniref:Endonuclease MutS2 n=1 Tax=Aceticella autotrophica TaxID=2755338 RepID=A0A975GB73_9THEO|nr:endonuclease MutS2 [Aceticella autotrophica]QSZ27896.1 endonuclease MutS2 [Aceticella autotrophica]
MIEKYLKNLEYDKIIKFIADYCDSEPGKEDALKIRPLYDIDKIEDELNKIQEAVSYISSYGTISFLFKNLDDIIKKAEIGFLLNTKQLLKVAGFLALISKVKAYLKNIKDEGNYPILSCFNEKLMVMKELWEKINSVIISEEEIADDASPLLRNLRKQKVKTNEKIKNTLNSIITSSSKELQEPIITVRQGRYVVPVKQEYKGSFKGLIHDQSSSGATLFIEPMQVVELNNNLKQLELLEQQEIERILSELSHLVSENADAIKENAIIMKELDLVFAKAKYSIEINASKPQFNEKGYLNFKNARHPLIEPEKVVPINIYLGDKFDTLVITGPNTGGKTVTLKTVGLLTLMALSGLNIPADEGSEVALFNDVFVDIGDEQSIEQSLSTFSAHMINIVQILNKVSSKSLVLLDELGAGTDPTEGAALAMSILDYLHNIGARTIATTHYSELKQYALKMVGIENASVEFDVNTLKPTYRLTIGIPGKSNAFEISMRLGLPQEIIENAKSYITEDVLKFEDLLKDLEEKRNEAEKTRLEVETLEREIQQIKREYEMKNSKIQEEREKILEKAKIKAKKLLDTAKATSEEIIKKLREADKCDNKNKIIEEARLKLKNNINELEDVLTKTKKSTYHNVPKDITPGQSLYIVPLDQNGTALSKPDRDGNVEMQAGILKIKVNITNLRLINEGVMKDEAEKGFTRFLNEKTSNISTSIDVRGKNLDEAIMEVDKYIDDAYLAGLKQITIIHGKGTGILRSGISQLLNRNKHVKSHRLGVYGEGGDGVTIVEIEGK